MKSTIYEIARFWAESAYFDAETRQEIQTLLDQNAETALQERFGSILEFGTGGLRGIMGAGINRMNRYTVRQTTEGVARYIAKQTQHPAQAKIVIGYDTRHHSFEFAQTASEVFAAHGMTVYLFRKIAPTPQVSFEVLRKKAIVGIMITASHNPPEYNGYKVYWQTGGQVVPPHDQGIIAEVRAVKRIEEVPSLAFAEALKQKLVRWLDAKSDQAYFKVMDALALGNPQVNQHLGVVYTPLHGTGQRLVPALLQRRGFTRTTVVAPQATPDGNFSTVRSPNPEDRQAFQMAQSVAQASDELILANDPDADRLGVMVRDAQRQWQWLNGNQIGVLLLDYYLSQLQQQGKLPKDGIYIGSLVTTPMALVIAQAYGLQSKETLTGFKWIWEAALQMEEKGEGSFVFGMEESHGYLTGHHSGDKDGIWAALAFAEMTATLKTAGVSVLERLEQLYKKYGYFLDALETLTLPGLEGMQRMQTLMTSYRQQPPARLGGHQVLRITDLKTNQVQHPATKQSTAGPGLPASDVVMFELEHQHRVIVRPSGTEPKIKFYFNLRGAQRAALEAELQKIKKDILP